MNVVLAAIDHTGVADSVVETATTWAEIAGAAVRIIHVSESPTTAASVSDRFGDRYAEHELLVVDGNPSDEIVRAVADPDVALVVVGARQEVDGARPAGHIALSIVERANKPVVVVPPCAGGASATERSSTIRRALVPLEGSAHTSEAIAATLRLLTGAGIELIALHVFDADSVPAFWDQPSHAAESYAADFVSRWCAEPGTELRFRRGSASETVVDVAHDEQVDLIALGWGQHLGAGRARIVRAALTHACVPVLLVPVDRAADRATERPDELDDDDVEIGP